MYDNSMDEKLQFILMATTGGVYENKQDVKVGFKVDNTLAANLFTNAGTPVKAMPADWYTLSNTSEIVIPKGKFFDGITVQLTNAFTADTNSVGTYWVIPLKMTSTTADSILSGRSGVSNPDPRIASNWAVTPKDFTLFGVKYVNEWHGKYLLRGTDVVKKTDGTLIEQINYHTQYLEGNSVVSLSTSRRNQVKYSEAVKLTGGSGNSFEIKINFQPNDITSATIESSSRYPNTVVTGTAKMVLAKDSPESWGNKPRTVIYLDYTIKDTPSNSTSDYYGVPLIHTIKDTLVFRDKDVKYEDFVPVVKVN
jgi:hypothetical protein